VGWLLVVGRGRGMVVAPGTSHCDKVRAAVLVLVLVLLDTVCVGGARFVGGVVCRRIRGCRSALSINFIKICYHNDAMPPA
jgi:hypothetical protein